jgi:hypothetical protein
MSPVPVDLVLSEGTATVMVRRRSSAGRSDRRERYRGPDAGAALSAALQGSSVLRTLRRVDLRILLETAEVVLRVVGPDEGPGPRCSAAGDAVLAPPVRVPLGSGAGPRALEVALERRLIAGIGAALGRRRFIGSVRMELGSLARARTALARIEGRAIGRPGVILDVTRSAVTRLVLDDEVVAARAVPATDLRAALRSVAADPLRELVVSVGRDGRRGWVLLCVPAALRAGVVATCADLLPPGGVVDLAVVGGASG